MTETPAEINEYTAHAYCDTYTIRRREDDFFIAVEHNKTEADALASHLTNRNGCFHSVTRNTHDQVRAAREFITQIPRHPLRDEAFESLGIFR